MIFFIPFLLIIIIIIFFFFLRIFIYNRPNIYEIAEIAKVYRTFMLHFQVGSQMTEEHTRLLHTRILASPVGQAKI